MPKQPNRQVGRTTTVTLDKGRKPPDYSVQEAKSRDKMARAAGTGNKGGAVRGQARAAEASGGRSTRGTSTSPPRPTAKQQIAKAAMKKKRSTMRAARADKASRKNSAPRQKLRQLQGR